MSTQVLYQWPGKLMPRDKRTKPLPRALTESTVVKRKAFQAMAINPLKFLGRGVVFAALFIMTGLVMTKMFVALVRTEKHAHSVKRKTPISRHARKRTRASHVRSAPSRVVSIKPRVNLRPPEKEDVQAVSDDVRRFVHQIDRDYAR